MDPRNYLGDIIPPVKPEDITPDMLTFSWHNLPKMAAAAWKPATEWSDVEIVDRCRKAFNPGTGHYQPLIFEGMKVYRDKLNRKRAIVAGLRAGYDRMNNSACLMGMPTLPLYEKFAFAVTELVRVLAPYLPSPEHGAFYIRPTLEPCEEKLGVDKSPAYLLLIQITPVGVYMGGFKPASLVIGHGIVRTFPGGCGAAKTAINYNLTMHKGLPLKQRFATTDPPCVETLYLDEICWFRLGWLRFYHTLVSETSGANVIMVDGKNLIHPSYRHGTILPSITLRILGDLWRNAGGKVFEKEIKLGWQLRNRLPMACVGTAAGVVPIVALFEPSGKKTPINGGEVHPSILMLHAQLTDLRCGTLEDRWGWTTTVGLEA